MQKNEEDFIMEWWHILIIVLLIVLIALVVLYFVGTKMAKKQEAQKAQMEAMKQVVSMLVIDKKKMRLKDLLIGLKIIQWLRIMLNLMFLS